MESSQQPQQPQQQKKILSEMTQLDVIQNFVAIVAQGQKAGAFDTIQYSSRLGRACKHFIEKDYNCNDIKNQTEAVNIIIQGMDMCQHKGLFTFDDAIKIDDMMQHLKVLLHQQTSTPTQTTSTTSQIQTTSVQNPIPTQSSNIEELLE